MDAVTRSGTIFCIVALAVLIVACGGAEERKAAHLEKGKGLYEQGQYVKARLEFKNVLQIDPKHVEALYMLGLADEKIHDWREAFASYSHAVKLDPGHVDARVKLGNLHLLNKAHDEALGAAEAALTYQPDHADALVLRGLALSRLGDREGAMRDARMAWETHPGHVNAASLLAWLYAGERQTDEAVRVLRAAARQGSERTQLDVMLAGVYSRAGRHEQAVEVFREVVLRKPRNVAYRTRLAALYAKLGKLDQAERVLREGVELEGDNTASKLALVSFLSRHRDRVSAEKQLVGFIEQASDAYELRFALARLYEADDQPDKVKRVYRDIIETEDAGSHQMTARNRLAQLLLKEDKLEEAGALVEEVLEDNPNDSRALLISGSIALAQKDAGGAIADARTLLRGEPTSPRALRLLARAHLLNRDLQLAKGNLEKAVRANPRDIQSRLELTQLQLQMRVEGEAVASLVQILALSPDHSGALEAMAKVHIKRRKWAEAEQLVARMKAARPHQWQGYYMKGLLEQARGNWDKSIEELELALEREPRAIAPLTAMTRSHLALEQPDQAFARVKAAIGKWPGHAAAYKLLGDLLSGQRNHNEAIAAYGKAIELKPKWAPAYLGLGNLHLVRGDEARAIEVYQQGLEAAPDHLPLSLQLANAYEKSGDYARAISELERVLKQRPDADVAANNLAMLLINHRSDQRSLDTALVLAQRFEHSRNPAFGDTLGWVHYKRGDVDQAIAVLQKALLKAPDAPVINYHSGMAYLKKGRTQEATTHLSKAVRAKAKFLGLEEARQALARP